MKFKNVLPIIVSIPPILSCTLAVFGQVIGTYPLDFVPTNWLTVVFFLPLFTFAACIAMLFIKGDTIEWRVAAIINAFPLVIIVLAGLLGLGR